MKVRFIVFLVVAVFMAACGSRGPAYKDINTNQQAPPTNPSAEGPAGQGLPNNMNAAAATGGSAAPPPRTFRMPAFMDTAKGYPKDLPNYPQATIVNFQYGPVESTDTFSAALQTHDAMDKISAFYDKTIKGNGWTVASRVVDPEYSEWILKKASDDEAKVTVRKDKQTARFYIVVARTSKQSQPAPPKPQS
jgi:predicted small lipoprotein YifL